MTCRDVIEFLMDYVSGELPPDERAVFESHLANCPACVSYLRSYRTTVELAGRTLTIPDESTTEIPEDLVTAVLAARNRSKST